MRKELPLRDYQRTAIDRVFDAWDEGIQRPAVVLPTGAGKTVIFSHLAKEYLASRSGRIVILVHRDELVNQTVDKLHSVAPHLVVGIVKAERNDVDADVIVASVQTLRKDSRLSQITDVAAVIVDECHHATADSYLSVLRGLGCMSKADGTPAVGFTATMDREDRKSAKIGLGDVWDKIVYQRDILDMIPDYLVDVSGHAVTIDGLTLAQAKITRGDFSETSLSDLLLDNDAQKIVAEAYVAHARDRKGLVFVPTVKAAHAFAGAFVEAGIEAAVVHGTMPVDERRSVLRDFAENRTQVLVNCMVLTEGFDMPDASCCVIARPTRSASLYVQMVGRVLRPFPGKKDALVLDVVGATEDHTLATLADLSTGRVDVVEPGETLTGAARRLAKNGHPGLAGYVIGTKAVSLFEKSASLWSQTKAGVWFVATGCSQGEECEWAPANESCRGHLVFLWPGREFGTYRVGIRPTYASGGRWVVEGDHDLPTAMSWGEEAVRESDTGFITNKRASWRKRGEAPSPAQLRFAARLGIEVPEMTTKAQLSDMINVVIASRVLDGKLPKSK